MSVWTTAPVYEEPSITLSRFRILEDQNGNRYFVGYNDEGHEGRVSTAIQKWDGAQKRGVTKSGRVYHLVGKPDYNKHADYVWQTYKRVNKIFAERDVTHELSW